MPIFDATLLAIHATVCAPTAEECTRRLNLLDRLRRLRDDGTLRALVETRVEQSFNERLFAEIFDYRTLLRDGEAAYHLQPKEYSTSSGQYDDFSLGFFGPGGAGVRRVSAELKGITVDLDAPQSGRKDKATPVQQAHAAVAGEPTIRWVLVSNYDEVRLYRAGDSTRFERVVLTEIDTTEDFRRAYALLGRASLLGAATDEESPLERLWREKERRMLSSKVGHARLIHEATPSELKLDEFRNSPIPLHRLDDALRETFAELEAGYRGSRLPWWPTRPPTYSMKLVAGKLRCEQESAEGLTTLVEASPAGAVRVWEHVGSPYNDTGKTVLQAKELASAMAAFVHLAGRALSAAGSTGPIRFRWSLREINGAILGAPGDWSAANQALLGSAESGGTPWITVDFSRKADEKAVADLLGALRELLFSFERERLGGVVRLAPPSASFAQVVGPSVSAALRIA